MRKLILSMATSLDGFIARPDGDLSWFLTDEVFEAEMLALLRSVDAMLFGRVSYELLAEYWPTAGTSASGDAPGGFTSKEREREFARLMNEVPKVVFSRTLTRVAWANSRIASGNAADELASMKAERGKDVVLFAGAELASTFIGLDAIDEYRLNVHPIVLGRGLPLFRQLGAERPLELLEAKPFPSGVVGLRYERARRPGDAQAGVAIP